MIGVGRTEKNKNEWSFIREDTSRRIIHIHFMVNEKVREERKEGILRERGDNRLLTEGRKRNRKIARKTKYKRKKVGKINRRERMKGRQTKTHKREKP